MRGIALARAAVPGVDLRAFGPVQPQVSDPEYEGSTDWAERVVAFAPDLLLGDVQWIPLDDLRVRLAVPTWLLLRWVPSGWLRNRGPWRIENWERRISVEPAADAIPGITHRIPPIVGPDRWRPLDGSEVRAGTNAWWESVWYGWHNRVRWYTDGSPERQARIDAGPVPMTRNGADVLMEMIGAL